MDSRLIITGLKPLQRALQNMPVAMRTRVLVPAATKSIKVAEQAIMALIPVQKGGVRLRGYQAKRRRAFDHYRNMMTSAVRQYPQTGSVVALTGAESGTAPHAHLVERGTQPRFTNSRTIYGRVATGTKTVIKNGRLVTRSVRARQAVGSRKKRKNGAQFFRGIMPAFHPVQRGMDAASATISSMLQSDIAAGITRELTGAKLQRGVA